MLSQQTEKAKNICFIPSAHRLNPRCPVSATPSKGGFANRSIPALRYKPKHSQQKKQKICTPSRQRTTSTHARLALSAGVQTMRARICSAFSCDMFARVVQLKLRVARHCRFPLCPLPHTLATHYFLRLTRARGVSSQREGNALFDDFWYTPSRRRRSEVASPP